MVAQAILKGFKVSKIKTHLKDAIFFPEQYSFLVMSSLDVVLVLWFTGFFSFNTTINARIVSRNLNDLRHYVLSQFN